jgi:hypothetical protein
MLKKAVIDIDNTLWHFCDALYGQLKAISPAVPAPDHWVNWDFWMHYCSEDEFWAAINRIHLNQDDDAYMPYDEAGEFLGTLKDHDFHIVIASHRTSESFIQTKRWLRKHDLIFDELHCSPDKTLLFDEFCHIVVDDSPFVLERAVEKGVMASGLMFPWNRNKSNNGYKLFNTLNEVLGHILDTVKHSKLSIDTHLDSQ